MRPNDTLRREMAVEARNERRREAEASRGATPTPSHDIVAIGHDGSELFVTESVYHESEAQDELESVQASVEKRGKPDDVSHYEIRERE